MGERRSLLTTDSGVGRVVIQSARRLHPVADAEFGQDGFDMVANRVRPAAPRRLPWVADGTAKQNMGT